MCSVVHTRASLLSPLTVSCVWIAKQLIYEKLPNDISDRHVLLLDPILGTGSFVLMVESLLSS